MWRILLLILIYIVTRHVHADEPPYSPYTDSATNIIYNQLFCDDLSLYRDEAKTRKGPWLTVFASPLNLNTLRQTALSKSIDARTRLLAFKLLKQHHALPKKKQLLGVIVEVGFKQGLDTLAAYADKSVRYINRSSKYHEWLQPTPAIDAKTRKLFQETMPIIEKIGPWNKSRLPPPVPGQVRLSFLVSDGLYFGQGSMKELSRSPLAGPVLTAATELLFTLTR